MPYKDDDAVSCRNCFVSCCNCFVSCSISVIINFIFFVCVASFLIWLMLLSNAVKFQVQDAELTRFDIDLEKDNNVYYNLSLTFSIRNSNSYMGIHYDRLKASVYYSDQRLASVSVPSFYQGHKSTTVLETVFQGQNRVLLSEHGRLEFEDDRDAGVYGIDVKLRIRSRVLFLNLITWQMKPIVRCHLKVPLGPSNSSKGFNFQLTKCHLNF